MFWRPDKHAQSKSAVSGSTVLGTNVPSSHMAEGPDFEYAVELAQNYAPPVQHHARQGQATLSGPNRLARAGQSDRFWQHRLYQSHDAVKDIDWRHSARTTDLYVRQTHQTATYQLQLYLLTSPSMRYRSGTAWMTKLAYAQTLFAAIGLYFLACGYHCRLNDFPTIRSVYQFKNWCHLLEKLPENFNLTHLGAPPRSSANPHTNPGQKICSVILSDFLPLTDILSLTLPTLPRNKQTILYRLQDPAEAQLPIEGNISLTTPQSISQAPLHFNANRAFHRRYHQKWQEEQEKLARLCRQNHWQFQTNLTTAPLCDMFQCLIQTIRGGYNEF